MPIDVSAVGPWMCAMAGEVADGIHVHPLHSLPYLHNRLLPAVAEGAARAGRDPKDVQLTIPVFAIPGDTPEEQAPLLAVARTQIAFYGSTRNYAFQFDDLGFEGTSAKLNEHLKAGDLDAMAATITDDMLEHFAVVGAVGRARRPPDRPLRRPRDAARDVHRASGRCGPIRRTPAAGARWPARSGRRRRVRRSTPPGGASGRR